MTSPRVSRRWAGKYREDIVINPDAEDQLRQLHNEYVAKSKEESSSSATPRASVLREAFGPNGSWCCFGAMPVNGFILEVREEPYATREWSARPQVINSDLLTALVDTWQVAAINLKGYKGDDDYALCQDNFSIARLDDEWEVFCVFDGHGCDGHWPSYRVAQTIPSLLRVTPCAGLLKRGHVEEALKSAFLAAHNLLVAEAAEAGVDIQFTGTTATVCVRHAILQTVWVATVGDSRAIMMHPSKGLLAETRDHTPSDESERRRLVSMGAEVEVTDYGDGYVAHRVKPKGVDASGLAMARSLGDCWVKDYGVIAEPEVVKWDVSDHEGAFLLACSDGVWEFISSENAAGIVNKVLNGGGARKAALDTLLRESIRAWQTSEGGSYTDDITMVLAPLTGPQAPRWDADFDNAMCYRNCDARCALQ